MKHGDVIIMGAGPAGLTACFHSGYYGLKTKIFEEKTLGGEAAEIPFVDNYPGCDQRMTGKELTDKIIQQCKENGGDIHQFEKIIGINLKEKQKIVKTEKLVYPADHLIIASGTHPRILDVPGGSQFKGRGVSYCAVCDGTFFKNKKVVVIGGNSRAAEVAIYLSDIASHIKLICQEDKLCSESILIDSLEKHHVEILEGKELKEIKGELLVKSVVLYDKQTENTEEIETDGVFFQLEGIPNSQIAKDLGVEVNEKGYILVDEKQRTNVDNVYAVGDVTDCPVKLVSTAVSQAAVAVLDILERNNRTL